MVGDTPLPTRSAQMRQKVDKRASRKLYAKRVAIVEPVFANVRIKLDRFNYRGHDKVNSQWLLYCLVHNSKRLRATAGNTDRSSLGIAL